MAMMVCVNNDIMINEIKHSFPIEKLKVCCQQILCILHIRYISNIVLCILHILYPLNIVLCILHIWYIRKYCALHIAYFIYIKYCALHIAYCRYCAYFRHLLHHNTGYFLQVHCQLPSYQALMGNIGYWLKPIKKNYPAIKTMRVLRVVYPLPFVAI